MAVSVLDIKKRDKTGKEISKNGNIYHVKPALALLAAMNGDIIYGDLKLDSLATLLTNTFHEVDKKYVLQPNN